MSLLRVLVVDDSPVNRHLITEALASSGKINVVGHASNGEQALRMMTELAPEAITLDVEMPKMDGFTFLRIMMTARPVPVVVLSSYSHPDNIFRALELGAMDFVAKPDDLLSTQSHWRAELVEKLLMAPHAAARPRRADSPPRAWPAERKQPQVAPRFVVGIASSTGGPGALLSILSRVPQSFSGAVLVAQHMAPAFTKSFAERLHRTTPLTVAEAQDGDAVYAAHAYVCPGGACMELRREGNGLRLRVGPPNKSDRYVPSGSRLLASVGQIMFSRAIGLVLTGMADDGVEGARAIRAAGGMVIAESEETAVVNGMPGAVVRAGLASKVLPLHAIADELSVPRNTIPDR